MKTVQSLLGNMLPCADQKTPSAKTRYKKILRKVPYIRRYGQQEINRSSFGGYGIKNAMRKCDI